MVAHCLGEVYVKWPVRGACEGDIWQYSIYIYIRVQWFLYFQNETHTVVLYDLRSPNPKYDPLKLRFSIWARPLKVLPFLIYILSIWISRRQWRQRRRRDKSAGSTHTFSRRVPAIVINHWFYCKLGLLWRLKRCELPPPSRSEAARLRLQCSHKNGEARPTPPCKATSFPNSTPGRVPGRYGGSSLEKT